MLPPLPKAGVAGAFAALGVATCCILPVILLFLGVGGSWVAIIAGLAVLGYYVAAAASLLLVLAWISAIRRGVLPKTFRLLVLGSGLSALAWLILAYETRLNDFLGRSIEISS